MEGRAQWVGIGCAIGLALAAGGLWYASVFGAPPDELRVSFLDVGQGDAILIQAPGGATMLVDGGRDSTVLRELADELSFFDHDIDVVLATHPDADHIGGLPGVFNRYDIGLVLTPGLAADTDAYRLFQEVLDIENVQVLRAKRGMVIELGPMTHFTILFPDRVLTEVDPNAASVTGILSHGETSFLLSGDAPATIERYLVQLDDELLDVDVLKAGHHGSDTSSALLFLGYASPEYAVISAGKGNSYGHPHERVLARLAQLNIETLSTAQLGTIAFTSDGHAVTLVEG